MSPQARKAPKRGQCSKTKIPNHRTSLNDLHSPLYTAILLPKGTLTGSYLAHAFVS